VGRAKIRRDRHSSPCQRKKRGWFSRKRRNPTATTQRFGSKGVIDLWRIARVRWKDLVMQREKEGGIKKKKRKKKNR